MSLSKVARGGTIFISPSPFAPVPVSSELDSSFRDDHGAYLFSEGTDLRLTLVVVRQAMSPTPLVRLLCYFATK